MSKSSSRTAISTAFGLDFSSHKKAIIDDDMRDNKLQVVGVGLPRCTTTSLKRALEILGFDPCHHMIDCVDYPIRSTIFTSLISSQDNTNPATFSDPTRLATLKNLMKGYKAAVDTPICDLYRELSLIYPGLIPAAEAKFILNTRDSPEAWWTSFKNTLDTQTHWPYRILTFPIGFLRKQAFLAQTIYEKWKTQGGGYGPAKYRQHVREVKAWFPQERLLEFNAKQGWQPLCEFLDVPVPKEPFPHLNDTKEIKAQFFGAQLMGGCAYLLGIAMVAGATWLAMAPPMFVQSLAANVRLN